MKGSVDYEYCHKVIVVGDSAVGKTSLLRRYIDKADPLDQHLVTLGVDFKMKTLELGEIGHKVVKMQLWDTAGQERFDSISKSFWRGARGVLIIFAVDCRASFEHVKNNWFPSVAELTGESCEHVVLVGNKCDVPLRQVTAAEASTFAADNGIVYVETSALADTNVTATFYTFCLVLTQKYMHREMQDAARQDESLVKVQSPPKRPPLDIGVDTRQRGCGC